MWAQPEIELPKQVVEQATDAPFSGVLPARTGGAVPTGPPHGMMGPPQKAARAAAAAVAAGPMGGSGGGGVGDDLGGGAPMGVGGGVGSLRLPPQHQQMQMQAQQQQQQGPPFDGPPGFLFEIESQVRRGFVMTRNSFLKWYNCIGQGFRSGRLFITLVDAKVRLPKGAFFRALWAIKRWRWPHSEIFVQFVGVRD